MRATNDAVGGRGLIRIMLLHDRVASSSSALLEEDCRMAITMTVNGTEHTLDLEPDMIGQDIRH